METVVNGALAPDGDRVEKRTRRRVGNKSIIQSAIARKERSLRLDDRPKKRPSRAEPAKRPQRSKPALRPVKPEPEDEWSGPEARVAPPLCKCTEDKQLFMENAQGNSLTVEALRRFNRGFAGRQFCSAVDGIGDQLFGCCRLVDVTEAPLSRPSVRVPFGVLCGSHRQRLIRHNCCPICGVFCTHGRFAQCAAEHHFHKDCQQEGACPHCADPAPCTDITITMHSPKQPVFLPVQRSQYPSTSEAALISITAPKRGRSPEVPIIPPGQLQPIRDGTTVRLDECNHAGLVAAVEESDAQRAAVILETGNVDLHSRLPECNNGTFLHLAVQKGDLPIVYLLVAYRVDLDALDAEQGSALMLAVTEHRNQIAQYLITAGAQVALKGTDGMTALHAAARTGNLAACQALLRANKGLCDMRDDGGWTPLVWACEHGFTEVARFLLDQGADIHSRDVEQNVALHWAAFKGSAATAELLLNLNSDVNVVNVHGDTPLHMAAREDCYNCVLVLLARRADVSLVNKNSETALDCAPKTGKCFAPLALNAQMHFAISNNPQRHPSLLSNDISNGREQNPIQCVNDVDASPQPNDYTYIAKTCVSSGNVQIDRKVGAMLPCVCTERCTCCSCAQGWYDQGKLSADFNFLDPPLIFECSDLCACNAILCPNRLVQRPLAQRFQLFRTQSKGWGVRALGAIGLGQFVCEYIGEILTDLEAESRTDDSFLFDLDNQESDSFCIDARFYGNFARFINHSCFPNLQPVKVFVEHRDLRFPHIAFFAKRDIAVNEELSFDYGDKFWLVKYKTFTCECRASCCRYSQQSIAATLA
ncbi:hypothetical protein YQE_09480, partial [Dendroctonus ponderosae]